MITLVLVNDLGAYRFVNNPNLTNFGIDLKATIDGELMDNWQSPKSKNNQMIGSN
jgi:hypothetical protein